MHRYRDSHGALRRVGEDVITQLFPSYREGLDRKRVTYRPFPRNSTQSLHIDSSYGYPTQGRGMLRIFTNINPVNRPRIWQLGEPFEPFVGRFLPSVCLTRPSWVSSILSRLGIVDGTKTKYDQYIAALRALGIRERSTSEQPRARSWNFRAARAGLRLPIWCCTERWVGSTAWNI